MVVNLPGYRVIETGDLTSGGRRVSVTAGDTADGCPARGVVSGRVQSWIRQQAKDNPHAARRR